MMVHELRYKGLYRYSEFCLFNLIATSFGDKCTPNKKKDQSALLLILTINTHNKDAIIHILKNRKNKHDLSCLYFSNYRYRMFLPPQAIDTFLHFESTYIINILPQLGSALNSLTQPFIFFIYILDYLERTSEKISLWY